VSTTLASTDGEPTDQWLSGAPRIFNGGSAPEGKARPDRPKLEASKTKSGIAVLGDGACIKPPSSPARARSGAAARKFLLHSTRIPESRQPVVTLDIVSQDFGSTNGSSDPDSRIDNPRRHSPRSLPPEKSAGGNPYGWVWVRTPPRGSDRIRSAYIVVFTLMLYEYCYTPRAVVSRALSLEIYKPTTHHP